jgi:diguanylate cyclase (GGDEF)-like protein
MGDSDAGLPQGMRAALDTISDGIFFVDRRGILGYSNEMAAKTLAKSGEYRTDEPFFGQCGNAIGNKLHDIFHVLSENQSRSLFASGEAAGVCFEVECKAALDGSRRFMGVAGIVRDVTERRRYGRILRQVSAVDSLTRVYNRRFFHIKLRDEAMRAKRQGYPLSLVILDLDNFKELNDTEGHLKGDAALRTVAELIKRNIREGVDIVSRYGGDEFTVILPEADIDQASVIARRVRDDIAAKTNPQVTASGGIAELGDRDPESLIHVADKALYRAKNLGGDLVFVAHEKQEV